MLETKHLKQKPTVFNADVETHAVAAAEQERGEGSGYDISPRRDSPDPSSRSNGRLSGLCGESWAAQFVFVVSADQGPSEDREGRIHGAHFPRAPLHVAVSFSPERASVV